MDELKWLETKAWSALQRGHYKMFGKLAAKWNKVNLANGSEQEDPFVGLRKIAERVRI